MQINVFLNVVRTQSLVIGSTPLIRKIESWLDVQLYFSICEQKIEMTTNVRYLGVQLESQRDGDKHIDIIKTKANRALGVIKYSKNIYPPDMLNKLYRGIVEPYLRYSVVRSGTAVVNQT